MNGRHSYTGGITWAECSDTGETFGGGLWAVLEGILDGRDFVN